MPFEARDRRDDRPWREPGGGRHLPDQLFVDAEGRPYDGAHAYTMHFDKDQPPPVGAFWSITMYDAEGFQCPNELNRFAFGDRSELTYNPDGSLDLYFQHAKPEAAKVSNWLPAPAGGWNLCLRLYAPRADVLDGAWNPPPVTRAR